MQHIHPILPILGVTMALVAYGRWRSDVVAVGALLAAALSGAVAPAQAFTGFAHPVVATIALLSIMGVAVRNSGLVEIVTGGLRRVLQWQTVRIGTLGTIGGLLSAVLGTMPVLSVVLPPALQDIRRDGQQSIPTVLPIRLLAAMGGLLTVVGTLPNLLVWFLRPGAVPPIGFVVTGLPVALVALATVTAAWRMQPIRRGTAPSALPETTGLGHIESYTSEVLVPPNSPLVGQTVHGMEARSEGTVTLKGIVRESFRRIEPRPDWTIEPDDVLVLNCDPTVLQRLMERAGLQIVGGADGVLDPERVGVVEAIVTPGSELVGRSPDEGGLRDRKVSLLAIGRNGRQPSGRLRRTKLLAGDALMLQGELATLPGTLSALGCLTLTERRLRLGRPRQVLVPLGVLLAALALAVSGTLPLVVALLAAVLLVVVVARSVTLDEIYTAVPWPVVVLVAALLPLSQALGSGVADQAAELAASVLPSWSGSVLPLAVLALALLCGNLLGGVVTVLVLLPFAAALAARLGVAPEPPLLALALGASCDLVMRARQRLGRSVPVDERPLRAWRLLLPLYLVVLLVGGAALSWSWLAR